MTWLVKHRAGFLAGLAVLAGTSCLALLFALRDSDAIARPPVKLVTRTGAPAKGDPVVASSLLQMNSYMSLGTPSDMVRERILSTALARALGKEGRALMAQVLDYTHEVMADRQSLRHSREQFFRGLAALNAALEQRGLGYYLVASFDWDFEARRVDQVFLEPLAIMRVRTYRANERTIRSLHVRRMGPPRVHRTKLGFTAVEYPEVFVFPEQVDDEAFYGLWPALDPAERTHMFQVTDEEARQAWYKELRERISMVTSEALGALHRQLPEGSELDPLAALHQALLGAVELHEIQHQLDYEAKPKLRGQFERLAETLDDKWLAGACMHETSAHLGQVARDPITPRVIVGEIASYAFADTCKDGDCLAALVILDELAAELGHDMGGALIDQKSYAPAQVAERYMAVSGHTSAEVQAAAGRAWERLFAAPLAHIEVSEEQIRAAAARGP